MSTANRPIRDFLYLDMERVRSFIAQIHEGVPETTTKESGADVNIEGGVEGSVLGLLRGKAGADYRYFRSQEETRSLHHHAYALLERHAEETRRLFEVGASFASDQWSRDAFPDGQLVRCNGPIRIVDYHSIVDTLREFPKLIELVNRIAKAGTTQQGSGSKSSGQSQKIDTTGVKAKDIQAMGEFIERSFGEVVRVKVMPSQEHPARVFAATALQSCFQDGVASVTRNYGLDLVGSWVAVGQVNLPKQADAEPSQMPFMTGNELEDMLDQVVVQMDELRRFTSGVKFPCISLNLIAIYREF